MRKAPRLIDAAAVLMLLAACGGGGSTAPTTMPPSVVAPAITMQPASVSVAIGAAATFSVTASGSEPLTYQWERNGTAITGAAAASYTTPGAQATDDGAMYSVVVTNSAGSVTSTAARLTVSSNAGGGGSGGGGTGGGGTGGASAADVVTFKNDAGRTGQYLVETTLNPTNVNSTSFGLLRNLMVDGKVDAQPLYLSQLVTGGSPHNVVFVATEHGSVYAFDADTGSQLWKVSLLASGETPSDAHGCGQVVPEIGVTSTPVIDRTAGTHGTLYVVAMSIDSTSRYHQRLHALDVTTGAELLSGPAEITASYPNLAGSATFDPGQYEERAALLLNNGLIYTSWSSHCDAAPYSGWVISFKQADLSRAAVVNVAPNSGVSQSGGNGFSINGPAIWMSGDGPGADGAGNVYFLTGNGRFETTLDANGFPNQADYGNSFVKIALSGAALNVVDYFTMHNEVAESQADQDLGSGGEMLLPDLKDITNTVKHLVVGAGKDGIIYLVDRDNMGKFDSATNNIWQEVDNALGGQVRSSPAFFNGTLYFGPLGGRLKAFSLVNAKVTASPASQSPGSFGYPGTSPVVSANGTAAAIVWAHENSGSGSAVLHAYDAGNLATELYNSTQAAGSRDQFGTGNKFITPTVAGGKVFVGTTNSVGVFGLLH